MPTLVFSLIPHSLKKERNLEMHGRKNVENRFVENVIKHVLEISKDS